jgi:uncharacterized membrane protein
MDIEALFLVFAVGCLLGWLIEVIFRSIAIWKPINPGFLKGPYLPIYGFSFLFIYLISLANFNFFFKILIVMLIPTILELIAGSIFIRKYSVPLWDYSNEKWNYKGIISFKFSLCWAFLSIITYSIIKNYSYLLNEILQFNPLIFLLILFYLIIISDFIYSFRRRIILGINENIEIINEKIREAKNEMDKKVKEAKNEMSKKVNEAKNAMQKKAKEANKIISEKIKETEKVKSRIKKRFNR